MTVSTHESGSVDAGPRRADGVELIGEMAGSGYRVPPSLARRADGQTIQLTPLLYAILRESAGHQSSADIAAAVSESTGRTVSADNVDHLVDKQLRPLGLLVRADGGQPVLKKRNPLLGLRFRYAVTDPERTRRLTDPFRVLFRPWVVVPMLAAFAVVCWWVFLEKGLASAAYDAFERPGLLILVFAVTILSAGFHEFGHAAAARYGGSTPGVMGVGLYLVWPAFYTDVTDSYRLGRAGRVRTDLGGLYFNAIVAVGITALWWGLRYDALLLVVATQILQMLRQLAPMVRFDGYHVLADLTGVPDLYSRIKPTLLGALPWRWGDPGARLLKPWARILVTCWVTVVIPLLISALAAAVIALPRLIGTAWASLNKQQDVLGTAWADGDMVQATARVLAMVAIVIPVAGVLYMLIRFVRQSSAAAWTGTEGKPVRRILVAALGVAIVGAVGYAWLPREDNYRPISPDERGTIGDIVYALDSDRLAEPVTGDVTAPRGVDAHPLQGQAGCPAGGVGHGHAASGEAGTRTRRHPRAEGACGARRRRRWVRRGGDPQRRSGLGVPGRQAVGPRSGGHAGAGGQHHRRHHGVRGRLRPGVDHRRDRRDERQRSPGLCVVFVVFGRGRRVPGRVRHRRGRGRRQRGGAAKPGRRAELRLRQLSDLRAGPTAVRHARRAAVGGRHGRTRCPVDGDRRLRRGHRSRRGAPGGDRGPTRRLREQDQGHRGGGSARNVPHPHGDHEPDCGCAQHHRTSVDCGIGCADRAERARRRSCRGVHGRGAQRNERTDGRPDCDQRGHRTDGGHAHRHGHRWFDDDGIHDRRHDHRRLYYGRLHHRWHGLVGNRFDRRLEYVALGGNPCTFIPSRGFVHSGHSSAVCGTGSDGAMR